jgi:type I restriction enzyme M protein
VLLIDASRGFRQGTTQNYLREQDIEKILSAYKKRETIEKYSYLADFDELKENDFNLNIPRYVDTFEPEPSVDLIAVEEEISLIRKQLTDVEKRIDTYLAELGYGKK